MAPKRVTKAASKTPVGLDAELLAIEVPTHSPADWCPLDVAGDAPPPLSACTACTVNEQLVILGGWTSQPLHDGLCAYIFDVASKLWKLHPFSKTPVLSQHSSTVLEGAVLTFFGWAKEGKSEEAYVLDLAERSSPTWGRLSLSRPVIPKLCFASVAVLDGKVLAFGGTDNKSFSSSLWIFDTSLGKWEELQIDDDTTPPSRSSHTMCTIGSAIYVFGGRDGSTATGQPVRLTGALNDVWTFTPQKWTQLKVAGQPPRKRYGHSAASVGDRMYIFGGFSAEKVPLNDLWVLAPGIPATQGYPFWQQISTFSGMAPSPRGHSTLTAINGKLYVFGGTGDGLDTNLWQFDPAAEQNEEKAVPVATETATASAV